MILSRRLEVSTVALALLAMALRAWHVGHGLPDFTEEAFVFRKALDLWGDGNPVSLNPHSFDYPSLSIYLHLAIQHVYCFAGRFSSPADFLLSIVVDPTGPVIAARMLGIAADVATLLIVGRIALRFGEWPSMLAMGIVAVSPTMITTSRLLNPDAIMCALSVSALDRLLVYRDRGGWTRLMIASAFIGLATGAKYPAIVLALPLLVAVWQRQPGFAALRAGIVAAVVATLSFLVTTPYLIVSWGDFLRDAAYLGDIARQGGLGKLEGHGFAFYALELRDNIGWAGIAVMAMSLLSVPRSSSGDRVGLLWLTWIVMFGAIAWASIEADRYMVSIVAVSSILMAAGAERTVRLLGRNRQSLMRFGVIAALVLQPVWLGLHSAGQGRTTTQLEAHRWCDEHLSENTLVITEAGGPQLLSHARHAEITASPIFRSASPATRSAFMSQRTYYMVRLPLIVSGHTPVSLLPGESSERNVYPHAVDWNAAVYDVRLLRDVDWVITSQSVRGRFEMDTSRFHEQRRFYSLLDRFAERAAFFESGDGVDGPAISIYRLTPRAREAIASNGGLDMFWWARTVPDDFKLSADRLLRGREQLIDVVPDIPLWAQPLRVSYSERYGPFANDLAENLGALRRWAAAEDLCLAALTVVPEDVWAIQVYAIVAGRLGKWQEMDRMLERSTNSLERHGPIPMEVVLARAEALSGAGDFTGAERQLRTVIAGIDPVSARVARERLIQLRAAKQ